MIGGLLSWKIDAGQILVSLLLAGVGYGLKQVYNKVSSFLDRVNDNEDVLMSTTEVVDLHSRALLRNKLIESPVRRLHRARRSSDHAIIEEEEITL